MSINLGTHQLDAIKKLRTGSILCGGVGTGKSRTALAYYLTKECKGQTQINGVGKTSPMIFPKDLYIITTARKRDTLEWEKECLPFLINKERENSISNVKVTIDSWNNISKYIGVKDAFFIFDEQRLVGSGTWVKSFLKITKTNPWIVLSATPGDTWMDFVPIFIANGFFKNRTQFLREHVIYSYFSKFPKIERYVGTAGLMALRKKIVIEMPYDKQTIPHHENIISLHDKEKFEKVFKDRWHIYEDRPIKDVGELYYVLRKVVNTDPSRCDAIEKIVKDHDRVIIFYNFNYELDILRDFCENIDIPYSEWNGHKHESILDSEKWIYLVQYTAGAEGWNCIETNCIIFYSLNYSYKIMIQSAGRIDRLNTMFKDLYYYHIRSTSWIDQAISKSLKNKKNFNENKNIKF